MKFSLSCNALFVTLALSPVVCGLSDLGNLSCYQCARRTNEECEPRDLQPCPLVSDRCVTDISKSVRDGFLIKRECGLGPCGFDDEMVNKGLGFNNCDRSKDEYICIFCCRESGCNKSKSTCNMSDLVLLVMLLMFGLISNKVIG